MSLDPCRLSPRDVDCAPDADSPFGEHCAAKALAIRRAERRLALVEELADIGMTLARDMAARVAIPSEESRREPGVAPGATFVQLSRAIRLTLAMEADLEGKILAIRNDEAPALSKAAGQTPPAWNPWTPNFRPPPGPGEPDNRGPREASKDSACAQRNRIRDAVWTAIDNAYVNMNDGDYALDRLHERLIEGEAYDAVLFRPWREAVEAICADLGLEPDWSQWSDETGFPKTASCEFHRSWSYWSQQADWNRKLYMERHRDDPEQRPPPPVDPALAPHLDPPPLTDPPPDVAQRVDRRLE